MKYIAKSLVVASALIGASTASAMGCFDFGCVSPYFGAEYEWTRANTNHHHRNDSGLFQHRRGIAKSYNGGNLFLGARWCDFALEAGYDFTGRQSRTFRNVAVVTSPTTGLPGLYSLRVKNRFEGFHVDANGYLPVCDCLELIGSLGIGWVRPRFSVTYTVLDATGITTDTFRGRNHNNYRGVFRLGIGAQYMVTECVGLRAMLRWKSINHRHRNDAIALGLSGSTRARDAASLSAGAFVKF